MIRVLLRLFGIKDFEVCASCENLKEQLQYERSTNKQLTETLIRIISPKAVESIPVELNPIQQTSALFSRRKAAMEQRDREEARILKNSTNIGKPDEFAKTDGRIEQLEKELGIADYDNSIQRAEDGV